MVQISPSVPARLSSAPSTTLDELQVSIQHASKQHHDHVVDVSEIRMTESGGIKVGSDHLRLSLYAMGQLASKLGIPAGYLKRCDPELQAGNVNRWLRERSGDVLLRMDGGSVRALLSTRYKPLDHVDLVENLSLELPKETTLRYELTEQRLEVQIVDNKATSNGGDPLHPGLHITNSEVGAAALSFSAIVYRTVCLNGLIMSGARYVTRRKHIGNIDLPKIVKEQVALRIAEQGREVAGAFASLRSIMIPEPLRVIEKVVEHYELTQEQRGQTESAFEIEPGDTLYHAVNAITRAGNSMDLALESRRQLQAVGGKIVEAVASGKRWLSI